MNNIFETNLKYYRQRRNIGQKELAAIIGITCQTYSAYERGSIQCDYDTLLRLSRFYDITVNQLLKDRKDHCHRIKKVDWDDIMNYYHKLGNLITKIDKITEKI